MGCLGLNAGQTVPTPCPLETAERMREEIRKVKALSNKPVAVNLIPDVPAKSHLRRKGSGGCLYRPMFTRFPSVN